VRRLALRVIGLSAGLAAALLVGVVMTLPPATQHPTVPPAPPTLVTGAYHVHSDRSDGSGSIAAIAHAAARAGIQFVILTDHGDGTRVPDPPAYREGVLMIDAVEVNTASGHLVALNLSGAAPYPLAGEARDVAEDIHRLGGWAIAAHPDSPRPDLRWRGGSAGLDGWEWLNGDSAWRGASGFALAADAARAWFRGPETIASLFQPQAASIDRWQTLLRTRPVFTIAALDAHARMGEDVDAGRTSRGLSMAWPSYETMFRTVTQTVALDRPWSQDPAADAATLLRAIGGGHSFSVVRAWVDAPRSFIFGANVSRDVAAGPEAPVAYGGALDAMEGVTMRADVAPAAGARLVLLRDGAEVASGESRVELANALPGVYRVEGRLSGHSVPWIVSNAIRVGPPASVPMPRPAPVSLPVTSLPLDSWTIEKHPTTQATVTVVDDSLRLRYQFGGGAPAGQYVALASSASGTAALEQIVFTASASAPLRLSVQIRLPGGANGQRWRRSVYVDQTPRTFRIPLMDLEPVNRGSIARPVSARVQSILMVIDTINARTDASGELILKQTGYGVSPK
jgi:hypothetical protein